MHEPILPREPIIVLATMATVIAHFKSSTRR
jgi:hypothetical protein